MQFRTVIPIDSGDTVIDYGSSIHSVGSCFAVNMAEKLRYHQFRQTVNPLGILFSPEAILQYFKLVCGKEELREDHFINHNNLWNYFDAHSSIRGTDRESLQQSLMTTIEVGRQSLLQATHLIITLGTAWVYRNVNSGARVANCHKLPQKEFNKELMTVEEIRQCIGDCVSLVRSFNPDIRIIWTISPVRHIKDGFVENNRSKAHLLSALHALLEADTTLSYFPSYEILLDELRDYRFYADDMLHPSKLAIDYIWEKFTECYIDEEALKIMREVASIQQGLAHRPFNPDSGQHQHFMQRLYQRMDAIEPLLPEGSFNQYR